MSDLELLVSLREACLHCLPAFDFTPPKRGGLLIDMGESDVIAAINRVSEVETLARSTPPNFSITLDYTTVSARYVTQTLYLPMLLIRGGMVSVDPKLRDRLDSILRALIETGQKPLGWEGRDDSTYHPSENPQIIELAAQAAAIAQIVSNSIEELSGERTRESIVLVEELSISELPRYPELGMQELLDFQANSLHTEAATIGPVGAFIRWCDCSINVLYSSVDKDHLATGYGLDDSQLIEDLQSDIRRSLSLLTVGVHLARKILASPTGDELVERLTHLHELLAQSVRPLLTR